MWESQVEAGSSTLVFRAPLFRVQKGLKVDFTSHEPEPKRANSTKAAQALAMGYRYRQAVESGEVEDFAALARKLKVSRAWVSMRVELTFLAPCIQHAILFGPPRVMSIQSLVRIARCADWSDQLRHWRLGGNRPLC
jgi:hypothetical protein